MLVAIERLALRIVRDSGGTPLRALADIKAAVERNIWAEISGGAEGLLDRVPEGGGEKMLPSTGPTWHEIGNDLGVSAQAAQRKYRWKR